MRIPSLAVLVLLAGCFERAVLDGFEIDLTGDAAMGDASEPGSPGCDQNDIGRPCSRGDGVCERVGKWVCAADRQVCDAMPSEKGAEICASGRDEDCDGTVDEVPDGMCCTEDDCDDDEACDAESSEVGRCVAGGTGPACPGVDLMTDDTNCGECAKTCAGDERCEAGACTPIMTVEPDAGMGCDSVDLMSDETNCGECGKACLANEICVAGSCEAPPPMPGATGSLSAGGLHVCGIAASTRELVCWGENGLGQADPPPGEYVKVAAGVTHTCAIRADTGHAACWGDNSSQQATPPEVVLTEVAAARVHSCGLSTSGKALCWGDDSYGQASPPQDTFVDIDTGELFSCGVKSDRSVVCWGDDSFGQSSPPPGRSWKAIALGRSHACGILLDDTVECWGSNMFLQSAPPPGTTFNTIAAGGIHSCGIRKDTIVQCWGGGPSSPQSNLKGRLVVAGNAAFTCAVTTFDDTATCWGNTGDDESIAAPAGVVFGL